MKGVSTSRVLSPDSTDQPDHARRGGNRCQVMNRLNCPIVNSAKRGHVAMRFLSQLVRPTGGNSWVRAVARAGRSRRPGRRLVVEALEPRRLLSGLTLTAAGLAD